MNDLERFLNLQDVNEIEEEVFVSERLGKFKVKAMTSDEYADYQKRCKGKMNKQGMDFDAMKFNLLLAAGQVVEPNFSNAELLKKAGCATAVEFIKRKLLPGEIAELSEQICKISGFTSSINEDVEEAKN